MKTISIRSLVLTAATAALFGFAGSSHAAAQSFTIHIGSQGPPPPDREEHPWAQPDRSAVWIRGHHEWRDGQYVWVGGYYTYPPHQGQHWTEPRYTHEQDGYSYHPGHWSN